MNTVPTFNFPHDSLVETSLFENDFIWAKFYLKFSENSQKSPWPLLQPLALNKNLFTGVFFWIF